MSARGVVVCVVCVCVCVCVCVYLCKYIFIYIFFSKQERQVFRCDFDDPTRYQEFLAAFKAKINQMFKVPAPKRQFTIEVSCCLVQRT